MILQNFKKQQLLVDCPDWLPDNTPYLVMMGSAAYGVSSDDSDVDYYGFTFPPKDDVFPHLKGEIVGFGEPSKPFGTWQQHHLKTPGKEYDFTIHSIVKYFQLCMENNPNMIDSLFVPERCIHHITGVGQLVRDNRHIFLHKGCWHRFKHYAYAQMHKLEIKEAHGKRKELIEKYGYDCYLEQDTEFLTDQGWKKFDQITDSDKIAEVEVHTGKILFSRPLEKIDKIYTGNLFIVEPYMSRCVVTPNHNMLVSPAHLRHHGYEYLEKLSDWKLIPIQKMINGEERSWYHTRRCGAPRRKGITVEDSYIKIAGLFISEGSISFRKGKVKSARITQTEQGKAEFFKEADKLGLKRYDYKKETVWTIPRKLSEKLFKDFGHGSRKKRLPNWTYKLSFRQSRLFWKYLCLGDGTKTPNGEVYYSVNGLLAGDIQAMMVSSGHLCSVRGPFKSISNFNGKELITYQVYLSKEAKYNCMDFHGSSRVLLLGQEKKGKSMVIQLKRFL